LSYIDLRGFAELVHGATGAGLFLIIGQAGFLEHDETVAGIRTFAREVYPRLKELYPDSSVSGVQAQAALSKA
jgi:hypothetical protein